MADITAWAPMNLTSLASEVWAIGIGGASPVGANFIRWGTPLIDTVDGLIH